MGDHEAEHECLEIENHANSFSMVNIASGMEHRHVQRQHCAA